MFYAIAPVIVYLFALYIDAPEIFREWTALTLGPHYFLTLRFSEQFMWNGLLGLAFCIHLLGMTALLKNSSAIFWSRPIAWLAGASFSIYVMHYPVLQFLSSLTETGNQVLDHCLLLSLTLVVCFAFAQIFERKLHTFRRLIEQRAHRLTHRV